MKINGTATIKAPIQSSWDFLTNADRVGICVPGLESMEIIEPKKFFKATATIGFGTVSVTFVTDVEWLELDEPNYAKMKAHGDGSGNIADVIAEMSLEEVDNQTTNLTWSADVTVVGTIASLASRLLPSVSKLLTNMFFNCVQKQIEKAS